MIGAYLEKKYKIIKLIGSGGMAHVFLAENIFTRRKVAVKVLKKEYSDNTEFLRRFELEARAVLKLDNENIVHAFDVGEYEGMPFIIMEYVNGHTLKEMLDEKGALNQSVAIDMFLQILSALTCAHNAGIIHRDVKPQNVIVDTNGKVKLTDFGIAREVKATTVTFAGSTVLGSAHYISPEQAQGMTVTLSSDIYSAGVMLYEMLTGSVPFTSDSTVSIALKHISDIPLSPIELNPDIFPSVNAVIMKALSKNPSDRFSSAKEMAQALKRAQKDPNRLLTANEPEESADETPVRSSPFTPHKPHWSWRITAVVLVVVFAFIGTFFGIRSTFVNSNDIEQLNPVPSLIGKTLTEATQKANSFGYTIRVEDYAISPDVPYGQILTQNPDAGKTTSFSGEIIVTVSSGAEMPTMPNLIGKTLEEAKNDLNNEGLSIGHITYQISDVAIGYICNQTPSAGTELSYGSEIDLVISSTSSASSDVPNVISQTPGDAIELIESLGFKTILVKFDESRTEEVVLDQIPLAGTLTATDSPIILTVGGSRSFDYSADIAFNLDIAAAESNVIIAIEDTIADKSVGRILFERTFEKGSKIPISFTAFSNGSGIGEMVLYVNGHEYRRQDVNFEEKVHD